MWAFVRLPNHVEPRDDSPVRRFHAHDGNETRHEEAGNNGSRSAEDRSPARTEACIGVDCDTAAAGGRLRPLRRLSRRGAHRLQEALLESGGVLSKSRGDFPWTVPVGHAILLAFPGVDWSRLSAGSGRGLSRCGRRSWLFATLAIWGALLRMPIYGACSLLLAAGWPGRSATRSTMNRGSGLRSRRDGRCIGGDLRRAVRPGGALVGSAGGPRAPHGRRIAADVPGGPQRRADRLGHGPRLQLSLYGYHRGHHPQPGGVGARRASGTIAPCPPPRGPTPRIAAFFTGQWPFQLNSQWKFTLDTPDPTLAEYLASRGYQTAGFVANTNCCSYETGLDRGFAHYEDYPLSPRSLLARTVPGNWIAQNLLYLGDYYA